jgi:RHS repeat-associated protein
MNGNVIPEPGAFQQSGTTRMTPTKQFDFLNRLTAVSSLPSTSSGVGFGYGYDLANQRTNVTLSPDGSRWVHSYDGLGQVISGKKYWRDGAPVAGQQFEYAFDDIGDRTQTKAGGDQSGGGLRSATYNNNFQNQITSREVPGTNDVIGLAHASASVTVNGQSVYRKGEYYWKELAATNAAAAAWQPVTNQAVLAGATNTLIGNLLTAPRSQSFWYDLEGNLLSDGVWTNTWDLRNRLLGMETTAGVAGSAKRKLDFTYDWQGRRLSKTVWNWTGSAWSKESEQRFVYDGWNVVAILDSSFSILASFTWGTDASGTTQGAGGVGGLISMTIPSGANAGTYFYVYDGNFNVVALANAANGALAAQYEYGPFHELIRATGPLAQANPFLAATKFYDWQSGLYCYGFRYYSPSTGRWLSRDPIGENGGINVSVMVRNSPPNLVDVLGLGTITLHIGIEDDPVSRIATIWGRGVSAIANRGMPASVRIYPGEPWELIRSDLAEEIGYRLRRDKNMCIDKIIVTAHGSPGVLGFASGEDVFNRQSLENAQSEQNKFLSLLAMYICKTNACVELCACKQAKGEEGRVFMFVLSQQLNAPIRGWEDVYGIYGFGNEWLAYPSGRSDLVRPGPAYDGSWVYYMEEAGAFLGKTYETIGDWFQQLWKIINH